MSTNKLVIGKVQGNSVSIELSKLANQHILAIGETGSGKSTLLVWLISQLVSAGGTIIAFNRCHSLNPEEVHPAIREDFLRHLNHVDVAKNGIFMQLDCPLEYLGFKENSQTVSLSIATVLRYGYSEIRGQKRVCLQRACDTLVESGLFQSKGIVALEEVLLDIGTSCAEELREILKPLLCRNLIRHGDFIQQGKINLLDMSGIDIETQDRLVDIVLGQVWREANAGKFKEHPISVFVDELQNNADGRHAPLPILISEGRRVGVNLLLATQMALQGTTSALQQRITQAGVILAFRPAANRIGLTAKMLSKSDPKPFERHLENLKVGEFICCGGVYVNEQFVSAPFKVDGTIDSADDVESTNVRFNQVFAPKLS